ncbi:MAG: mechanosensitive ion channel family protein, partial [Methanosarcina sp.]
MKVLQRLNFFILLVLILFTSYIRYFTDFYIFEDRSLLDALLISLFITFLAYVINSLAGNLILRRVSTARDRYTLRKTVSILVTVLAFAS